MYSMGTVSRRSQDLDEVYSSIDDEQLLPDIRKLQDASQSKSKSSDDQIRILQSKIDELEKLLSSRKKEIIQQPQQEQEQKQGEQQASQSEDIKALFSMLQNLEQKQKTTKSKYAQNKKENKTLCHSIKKK